MRRRILLFILVSLSLGDSIAQQGVTSRARTLGTTNTSTGKTYYGNRNEAPRAIEFNPRTVTIAQFLKDINRYFNIPAEFTFVEVESNTDQLGMRHRLLRQYYKGIPLEGMGYRVHERDGFVTSANGKAVRNINIDTHAIISESQAFSLAVKYLQTADTVFRQPKTLIVSRGFTFTPESFAIAFQFDMDVSFIESWRISIDAGDGQLINKVSLVNTCSAEKHPPEPYGTGTGISNYYGNRTIRVEKFGDASRLVGQTESGGLIGTYDFRNVNVLSLLWFFEFHKVYDFYSSGDTFNESYHKPAVSVQWGAEQAYEYYYKNHNRNSFDNLGSRIKSYVHVDNGMNNAFWTHNLLAFGDGSNNNPLVELDVVSHELTHGVTQFEAALQYYNEPGALNESFSDIFGKAVEFYTFGDTATWQLAKYYRQGGLRDMSNPNLKNHPDTWQGDMWYSGYEDNGGIHSNSGVQNFWFYLLCQGGSGVNDRNVSYSVNPIGMDAAAKIAYRNLTEYLDQFSDYLDSRIGSSLATADLYGKNSSTYQEVANAWDAVGVVDEPIITNLEVYDVTATTVKLKGSFFPRGDTVTYHFEYGTTPSFGTSSAVTEYQDKVEGILTGLQSETTYYIRLVATNEHGSSYSTPVEFTTISLAPLARIKETVDVTDTTAVLYGAINPNSLFTSFYFEYGTTPALGLVTPVYPLSDTTEFLDVSAAISDLQPRQTYFYKLVATNGFASTSTASVSFFTAVRPLIDSYTPATAPIGAVVTINGRNFNPIAENNIVTFGATRANVVSSGSTEIKVEVPAGASLGPISLLDSESRLTTQSVQEFVPTFTGEFAKSNLQIRVASNEYIYQTLVSDMDGDNRPDIVALHYLGFSVYQNLITPGGNITEESFIRSTFNSQYTPGILSLVDFDGNGLKDVVGYYQGSIRIYPNFSVPGYIFFGMPVDIPTTDYMRDLVFQDFDQDGHVDIAGVSYIYGDSTVIAIIRNQNPGGSLSAENFATHYLPYIPVGEWFLSTRDLNNDGKEDFMIGSYADTTLTVLKNVSHPGVFDFEQITISDPLRGRFADYLASDLNHDGWKDIISHNPYEKEDLAIFENEGASPGLAVKSPVVSLSDYQTTAVNPADINGDGRTDLLVATGRRTFVVLESKQEAMQPLTNLSFEKFAEHGIAVSDANDGDVTTQMTVNDLNGDGRPDVIAVHSYYYGPHDGYTMEIWQNAPVNCPDPSLVGFTVTNTTATVVLPTNMRLEDYDIDYKIGPYDTWYKVTSKEFYVYQGYSYKVRVRARCYLGFSEYYYKDITPECVNTNTFLVTNIGINSVNVEAYNLSSFQVQYSQAGKDNWQELSQYSNKIENLLAGTTYDVRFRGRCYNAPSEFKYKQFTTLCPKLATLSFTEVKYNKAIVTWTSNYSGKAVLEYSADNVGWTSIGEDGIVFPLVPGKQYVVRGAFACTNINSDFLSAAFTTPCPKATKLSAEELTPFSTTIVWDDEAATNNYTLTYARTGDLPTTVQTGANFFHLDELFPGGEYSVSVAPYCVMPTEVTVATFSTPCYAPGNLSAEAITTTSAELKWTDDFNFPPYYVQYSVAGKNTWQTIETTSTNLSLSKLRPGTEYEVRVNVNCLSQVPYVSVVFETGLYDETTYAPNPTKGTVTLYPSTNLIGNHYIIHDSRGKIIADGELTDYRFDFSDLSPGIYTLKIDGTQPIRIFRN
jgi:Zn-dependent metalloprotease